MTIALVTHAKSAPGAGTTAAFNGTGANALVSIGGTGVSGTPAFSDSLSSAYTKLTDRVQGSSRIIPAYTIGVTGGASETSTMGGGVNLLSLIALAFSGVLSFGGENGGVYAAGGVTTMATGLVTPDVDGCLLVSGMVHQLTSLLTPTLSHGTVIEIAPGTAGTCWNMTAAYEILGAGTAGNAIQHTYSWTGNQTPMEFFIAWFRPISAPPPSNKIPLSLFQRGVL